MRRVPTFFVCALPLVGLSGVETALAQGTFQPTPVVIPIIQAEARIDLEKLDDNASIRLSFTFNAGTFNNVFYRISYSSDPSDETQLATIQRVENTNLFDMFDEANLTEKVASGEPLPRGVNTFLFGVNPEDIIDPNQGRNLNRFLYVHLANGNNFADVQGVGTDSWEFQYDVEPPAPPQFTTDENGNPAVSPGERRLVITWTSTDSADIDRVITLTCPNAGVTSTAACASLDSLPCTDPETEVFDASSSNELAIGGSLRNGVIAAIALQSRDDFGNEGVVGDQIACAAPEARFDFYEAYRADGGTEDGGFCFIATAAYGSYAHPVVRILRTFRDRVLMPTPMGRAFVQLYYRLSPPWAEALRQNPDLAVWARWSIVPLALVALLVMMLPFLGAGVIGWRIGRRLWKGLVPAGLLLVTLTPTAHAARPDPIYEKLGFGFEFRAGPYLPNLANDSSGPEVWFARVHGRDQRNRQVVDSKPLFTFASELQVYRGIGTVAVGGSIGFMRFSGTSFADLENQTPSNDETNFNLLPMTLTAGYRFDWLIDNTWIPLVPYVRGGLAYYVWWSTDGVGDITVYEDPVTGEDTNARGGKLGVTGTIGISFLMNALEPRSAQSLHNATGIRATYIFAELQASQVDGFGGDGFDFSDATWNLGMFLEF